LVAIRYRARMTQIPDSARLPKYSVTKQRKRTSHTFHLIMTIITGGAWGILVWIPIILWHKMGPKEKIKTRYR